VSAPGLFTIATLRVGELYIPHGEGTMRDPVHVWLVRGEGVNILVDSGMPDMEWMGRVLKTKGWGGGHEALKRVLADEGLTPDDIDFVVPTHLHFDHGYNLDLFPKSTVVVQRDEIFHAIDPTPTQRIYYPREILIELINRKRPQGLRLIDGDLELVPGFQLLKLPSHTAGMQVPIVSTSAGKAALVSDLGDHYHYWYPADPRAARKPMRFLSDTFLAGQLRSSSENEWIAAMRRVLDHADIVVPAHDFRIPKRMPDQWFAIPDGFDDDLSFVPPGDMDVALAESRE
jgi:glyoxylase-like metal-dependent hydrolase (beta-lactamase superfamily II)